MEATVTIELQEGVKITRTIRLTSEMVLLLMSNKHTQDFDQFLTSEAGHAASNAMHDILRWFEYHGLVVQRIKNGVREAHVVKDINEARDWLSDGEPIDLGQR
jgi:hypothetical protein